MSRGEFAISRYNIGPCECPGGPHSETETPTFALGPDGLAIAGELAKGDWAEFKDRLTFGDIRAIKAVMFFSDGIVRTVGILRSLVSWSLSDEAGVAVPITIGSIDGLSGEQGELVERIADRPMFIRRPLPNSTGGSSPDGSAETPTPTSSATPTPSAS